MINTQAVHTAPRPAGEFHIFAKAVEARFRAISGGELFTVDATDLFESYLAAYPAGTNPLFRTRTEFDCSCCKNFVRNVGDVIALKNGEILTVWDIPNLTYPFDVVAKAMHDLVRQLPIAGVYRTKERSYGNEKTRELTAEGKAIQWNHFWCDMPTQIQTTAPDKERGELNTTAQVFRRGLDEMTPDAFDTVFDLIGSNAIYRGSEHLAKVKEFRELKRAYEASTDRNVFVWSNVHSPAARFKNSVIGTLLSDLSEGMELDKAVGKFEAKMAPENYKRTTALITPKMIDQAMTALDDLGLRSAVERRHAKLSDVSVNNVLFVDNSVRAVMKDGLADMLMSIAKMPPVDIKHAENIGIDDFLSKVVPMVSSMELLLKNQHLPQFVSITAPVHFDAGQLFQWSNDFAWSYDGDATDSIKERVKKAGGNDDAPLRVSLAWHNADDLDLHAHCPNGHIYYSCKGGILDVDMNGLDRHDAVAPVENLSWQRYRDGRYEISVNQFNKRSHNNDGFELEMFFNGDTKTFSYPKPMTTRQTIDVFAFNIKGGRIENFQFNNALSASSASKQKWGVTTERLVPVDTLMTSPNHWDENRSGNKHWFFVLKGCKNPDPTRGIYNEFLKKELTPHRKVFEVLGAKTKCPPADEQLSGVGFSSTRGDQVTVVVKGSRINKAFNVQF